MSKSFIAHVAEALTVAGWRHSGQCDGATGISLTSFDKRFFAVDIIADRGSCVSTALTTDLKAAITFLDDIASLGAGKHLSESKCSSDAELVNLRRA